MVEGTITRMVPDRGFGFITDGKGILYFFHYSALDPKDGIKFETLKIGSKVTFESEPTEKGPRARPRSLKVKEVNGNGVGNATNSQSA